MARQALAGLKVADFCWVIAGPMVGVTLAQHGATVVRVESMHRLDITRTSMPYKDGKPGINRSGPFDYFNTAKMSLSLNLSHPRAIEVARRLVAWADIVGENFAPGVMERLGLGYEELRKIKPDIIMYSSSNLGQTGPECGQPGLGVHLVAYTGVNYLTGWPDRMATLPWGVYTDFPPPRLVVAALLAAIEYRRRTGKGQHLDMSQMEGSLHFLAPALMDYTVNGRVMERQGNRSGYSAPHGAYRCRGDDRWCAIAVFDDRQWSALCGVVNRPAWTADPRFATFRGRKQNEDELDMLLGEWTATLSAEEIMDKLQGVGVPAGVLSTAADVMNNPQLNYRGYFRELDHPDVGVHHYDGANGCILSKTPETIEKPAPLLGQHTEHVCRELLGMSDDEFIDLMGQGVFE